MIVKCIYCRQTVVKPPYGGVWDSVIIDGTCNDCLKRYFRVKELSHDQR